MTTTLSATKPHFEILDGLRGVASVLVVLFHLLETYSISPADQIINHGYLAVDFFFVLSGFVVGYAYDDRWGRMNIRDFFKRRIIRLQPLVLLGTALGASLFFFAQGDGFPLIGHVPGWKFLLAFVMGCLMIPCGPKMDLRGWGEMNSFNGPNWSLTWEYVANILYAVLLRRLSKAALAVLTLLAGFCTLDLCLDWNVWGLLTEGRTAQAYTVIGGWSLTSEQVYIGLTRLFYPFLCGLLLSRCRLRIGGGFGFGRCSLLLAVLLALPCVGGAGSILNGLYNALCILVLFPLIVAAGAGSTIRSKRGTVVCNTLGALSYPLYITHYPLMYLQMNWVWSHPDAPLHAHLTVAAGTFLLSIAIAWAALKLYDLPVRDWLTRHWK